MKLGVFMAVFGNQSFDDALDYAKASGVDAVEIGTGNYPGDPHCPIDRLLKSKAARTEWVNKVRSRGLEISDLIVGPLELSTSFGKMGRGFDSFSRGMDRPVLGMGCSFRLRSP